MTQQEVFEFINNHLSCTLATCEGNKPHVRWMWMYRADAQGIVFHTGAMRDLYRQLLENPQVELCFCDIEKMVQVRVSGIAALESGVHLRDEIIAARPFLQPIVAEHGHECIAVFRVKEMMASVWSMARNLEPKEYIILQ